MITPPALFDHYLGQLAYGLDGLSQRQETIATNIANIDTPGYLTHDVLFEQQLQASLDTSLGQPALPNMPDAVTMNNLRVKNDGNNVDIDQQMIELSRTQLVYQTASQVISDKFSMLTAALAPVS